MAKRGNGEGSIVKRKDGRWMGYITVKEKLMVNLTGKQYMEKREKKLKIKWLKLQMNYL